MFEEPQHKAELTLAPPPKAGGSTKERFVSKTLTAPKTSRARSLFDSSAIQINVMLFGNWGTGKTRSIWELLKLGFKVLVINTDIGKRGFLTLRGAAMAEGKLELLQNCVVLDLVSYDEVREFLENPESFFPEIYTFDPDFVYWEGFSSFQQIDVSEYVGGMTHTRAEGNKEVSEQVASGLHFEQMDWGLVKNATVRGLDKFCSLHNPRTGKVWHKIVTCHESYKIKKQSNPGQKGQEYVETKMPMLQGAGGQIVGGAFDLIIRTVKVTKSGEELGEEDRNFKYVVEGDQNLMAKSAGVKLPPVMDANFGELWKEIERQTGLVRGAIDPTLIENKGLTE